VNAAEKTLMLGWMAANRQCRRGTECTSCLPSLVARTRTGAACAVGYRALDERGAAATGPAARSRWSVSGGLAHSLRPS
jgi:hypothetical protein